MRRIVTATRNPAKVEQLARLVGGSAPVEPPPDGVSCDDEQGDSFETIAGAKAVGWSRLVESGATVLASDGGLLIPALGDAWEPLRTRRFAGDCATGAERAAAVLALAADLVGADRRIGWREALAVAANGTLLAVWVAESAPGVLARDFDAQIVAAGGGFWAPAIWCCPEQGNRRLIELSDEERRHRGDHWSRLGVQLRAYLSANR
jgi:inosine/xanthosine triphosphate pyrophosphatase family protein